MRLERNLQAPVFQLTDIYGRSIDLNDYRDKKVLVGFFRHAGCPFCNIRVHALNKARTELREQGLEMIFFFESTQKVLLNSIFHKETSPVPIISDPEKQWYAAYGLEPSMRKSVYSHLTTFVQTAYKAATLGAPIHAMASGESFSTMPAEFLLGEGLVIREVHYSETLNDRIGLEKIRAFAKEKTVPQSV
jgi:peroxiredoxin